MNFQMLEQMFQRQGLHMDSELKRYGVDLSDPKALNEMHLALCRHLHGEADELTQCADWKLHQRGEMASRRTIAQELVDNLKFLINIAHIHRIGPHMIFEAFERKSTVVEKRVDLEKLKDAPEQQPLLICDLDGVLCDRDHALLEFARANCKHCVATTTREFRMQFGQAAYERLKRDFYDSGGFLTAPPFTESIAKLRDASVKVLICTSRDRKRYPHLEWETHEWLTKNEVPYAALLMATEKERALTWVDSRSVAIDDELEHVEKLAYVCHAIQYDGPWRITEAVELLRVAP